MRFRKDLHEKGGERKAQASVVLAWVKVRQHATYLDRPPFLRSKDQHKLRRRREAGEDGGKDKCLPRLHTSEKIPIDQRACLDIYIYISFGSWLFFVASH